MARPDLILSSGAHHGTTKVQFFLFLAFLLPAVPAVISTVWVPEESLRGVKLKLPVVRRYWYSLTGSPSRYTFMSSLVRVLSLSITVACTIGLEPLMFPTGLTEVMVTPLEPPRLGLDLAPDLVLGLDLCEVLRLLDLPTCPPFFASRVRCPRLSQARSLPWFLK